MSVIRITWILYTTNRKIWRFVWSRVAESTFDVYRKKFTEGEAGIPKPFNKDKTQQVKKYEIY